MDLKEIFRTLCLNYTGDEKIIAGLWAEIEQHYSEKGRYYHTLGHLENLYRELHVPGLEIHDRDAVQFALFYHDIIYNVLRHDNEEKSAKLGEERMRFLQVPSALVEKCRDIILATKKHEVSADHDINLFTDADLSVLGAPSEIYTTYAQNVRKEYSIYPDLLYNPGRKKVLRHFLDKPRIFKTEHFFSKYEQQARLNLETELEGL